MICNEFYNGQGLGNQLWCYVLTRIIAKKNNYDFGIIHPERFKGKEFLDIDFGISAHGGISPEGGPPYKLPKEIDNYYREQKQYLLNTKIDVTKTDENLLNIRNNTKFDGNCQSTQYLKGYREDILKWIQVKKEYGKCAADENTCVIHIRCGDYKKIKDVFLPVDYYKNAMERIKFLNKNIKFLCVTDQEEEVRKMFPDLQIAGSSLVKGKDPNKAVHHFGGPIGIDFCLLMNAKYLIIPNSSFSWWAAYLNTDKKAVIAPKYWASHNKSDGYWSTSDIITDGFTYIDRNGKIFEAEECVLEKAEFEAKNKDLFAPEEKSNKILKFHEFIYILAKEKIGIMKSLIKQSLGRIHIIKIYCTNFYGKLKTRIVSFTNESISNMKTLSVNFSKKDKKNIRLNRENIKIYDIFTYNGEADILEIRLNILYDTVDQFIIIEAPTTFSGLKKPLYFEKQKDRFTPFLNKIKYFVIDDYPNDPELLKLADSSSNVPKNGPEHWRREFYQKESIKKALTHLKDEDVCFIGDVDEIWNPEVLVYYTKDDIFKLKQKVYAYYLNNRSNEPWAGTMVTKYKNIKNNCLNHLRTKGKTKYIYIENGGWHFTSMGGINEVRRKLNDSYTKDSYNTGEVQEKLEERFGGKDYMGRNFKFRIEEKYLPKYLLENKTKYKQLFKTAD